MEHRHTLVLMAYASAPASYTGTSGSCPWWMICVSVRGSALGLQPAQAAQPQGRGHKKHPVIDVGIGGEVVADRCGGHSKTQKMTCMEWGVFIGNSTMGDADVSSGFKPS